MTLVGLELNATRARAVHGAGHGPPAGLDLEDDRRDLPMAVGLAERASRRRRRRRLAAPQGPAPRLRRFPPGSGPESPMDGRPASPRRGRRPGPDVPTPATNPRPGGRRVPDAAHIPHRPARSVGPATGRQGAVAPPRHDADADGRRPGRLPTAALVGAGPRGGRGLSRPDLVGGVRRGRSRPAGRNPRLHPSRPRGVAGPAAERDGRPLRAHQPPRPARLGRRRTIAVRPARRPAGGGSPPHRPGGTGRPVAAVVSEPVAAGRRIGRLLRPAGAAGRGRAANLPHDDRGPGYGGGACWPRRRPAPCPV